MRALLLAALLLTAGVAVAASSQDGDCAYSGDWRAQALPGGTGGPGTAVHTGVGVCALAEVVREGNAWTWRVRADGLEANTGVPVLVWVSTFSDVGSFQGDPIECVGGFCAAGPFQGRATSAYMSYQCAGITVTRDGSSVHSAFACA